MDTILSLSRTGKGAKSQTGRGSVARGEAGAVGARARGAAGRAVRRARAGAGAPRCSFPATSCGTSTSTSSTRCRRPTAVAQCSSASPARPTPWRAPTSSWSGARGSSVSRAPVRVRVSLPRRARVAARPAQPASLAAAAARQSARGRRRARRGRTPCQAGPHTHVRCPQTMLQADNIAYCKVPVRGIDDIVRTVDEVDKDSCHTVVLLNCGAGEDLLGMRFMRAPLVRARRARRVRVPGPSTPIPAACWVVGGSGQTIVPQLPEGRGTGMRADRNAGQARGRVRPHAERVCGGASVRVGLGLAVPSLSAAGCILLVRRLALTPFACVCFVGIVSPSGRAPAISRGS